MPEEFDYLTFDDVLPIAAGVLTEVGIRDAGLIESALLVLERRCSVTSHTQR